MIAQCSRVHAKTLLEMGSKGSSTHGQAVCEYLTRWEASLSKHHLAEEAKA